MNKFVLQQGQTGNTQEFVAPIEYFLTPELADCSYTSEMRGTVTATRNEYMQGISSTYSWGLADIDVEAKLGTSEPKGPSIVQNFGNGGGGVGGGGGSVVEPLPDEPNDRRRRRLGAEVSAKTKLNANVGNSKAAQIGRIYESTGKNRNATGALSRSIGGLVVKWRMESGKRRWRDNKRQRAVVPSSLLTVSNPSNPRFSTHNPRHDQIDYYNAQAPLL